MLLIKNTHMIDPASGTDARKDILIQDDKIIKIADSVTEKEAAVFSGKEVDMLQAVSYTHLHLHHTVMIEGGINNFPLHSQSLFQPEQLFFYSGIKIDSRLDFHIDFQACEMCIRDRY